MEVSIFYNKLLSIKDKFNIPICAEVNIDPPNELSINFHRKHGFSEITESTIKEGYSVVYMEVRLIFITLHNIYYTNI